MVSKDVNHTLVGGVPYIRVTLHPAGLLVGGVAGRMVHLHALGDYDQ